jgi:hypothetical protein
MMRERGFGIEMSPIISLIVPDDVYARQLHVLGAWWRLESSIVEPELLLRYGPNLAAPLRRQ